MAARMYASSVLRILKRAYPERTRFTILENNGPTGFKSKAGIAAKRESKISVFPIPPRSPDLNPCDFSLWQEVNKRMRATEKARPDE